MSAEWFNDPAQFAKDMQEPDVGFSIDRIDCRGPYAVPNCRWADAKQQAMNQRRQGQPYKPPAVTGKCICNDPLYGGAEFCGKLNCARWLVFLFGNRDASVAA